MKVAGITITLNDDYKVNEWKKWYEEYKNELALHIIVDNGSSPKYIKTIKSFFPNSIIIERKTNGGCTMAYNDGIKKALEHSSIDAIMLIGNDVRIEKGSITKLYDFLYSRKSLGIVSPVLFKKNSFIVEDYGANITRFLTMNAKKSGAGKDIDEITESHRFSETVLGGCCLAKPEFYQKVGLQDENLFMYSDEVDTGIRSKLVGYEMGYIKEAKAWHQHINPNNGSVRSFIAPYLINRNKIYLAKKHFGFMRVLLVFVYQNVTNSYLIFRNINRPLMRKYFSFGIKGSVAGLMGNMKNDSQLWK